MRLRHVLFPSDSDHIVQDMEDDAEIWIVHHPNNASVSMNHVRKGKPKVVIAVRIRCVCNVMAQLCIQIVLQHQFLAHHHKVNQYLWF